VNVKNKESLDEHKTESGGRHKPLDSERLNLLLLLTQFLKYLLLLAFEVLSQFLHLFL
jgi:hypothetical protein